MPSAAEVPHKGGGLAPPVRGSTASGLVSPPVLAVVAAELSNGAAAGAFDPALLAGAAPPVSDDEAVDPAEEGAAPPVASKALVEGAKSVAAGAGDTDVAMSGL